MTIRGKTYASLLVVVLLTTGVYAAKGWLAEVERFLKDRDHLFSDRPISLSMHLDNPPPHLWDDANGPFGYTMRIARGSVAVEARPDPSADGFERGDYNSILPLMWIVYDEDTEASYRANRELRTLLADGYAPPEGEPLDDRYLGIAFFDMHNHMARRTVNNPDVLHRARHLGLQHNLADLDETGYTVLENAFTADVLSTTLHVMGPDAGLGWAAARGFAACFLVPAAGSDHVTLRPTPAFEQRFPL
jgi:hypothetical protein